MMFVFIVTFITFPGAMDASYYPFLEKYGENELSWYFLLNSTFFSVFDTIGRKSGGLPFFNLENKTINVLSFTRVFFIATFILVAFKVGPSWSFDSTWFKIFNIAVFSFSNGFVSTICAVKAPQCVPEGN